MNCVFRCYVEKKPEFDTQAAGLLHTLRHLLGVGGLTGLRMLNRYDGEGMDAPVYEAAKTTVFSEPQSDLFYDETLPPVAGPHRVLAIEPLPGQYDQRADSCCQCIQLLAGGDRPSIATAQVYLLLGQMTEEEFSRITNYLMNPVESRLASLQKPETLQGTFPPPAPVAVLEDFTTLDAAGLHGMIAQWGLAMDEADLAFLQAYFRDEEHRAPTVTELRLVDTYWSDHCRHTTFATHIEKTELLDPQVARAYEDYLNARVEVYGPEKAALRPKTLMDIATIGAKTLKKRGLLEKLDQSEEINACSVHTTVTVDGEDQDWLLLFKNETHNHPTEIEPFGGAATCIGGAIRDPLSGRAYVYQAMRVTGCGDPTVPLGDTLQGKLPQRKLCTTAAAGYSSYGNQIGLATGQVSELYHPGYVAKHLEVGAVVGAVPAKNVVREVPAPGDVVILLGGRTGRDGIGGATGSSKTHTLESLDTCAAEVQKGNAPEERKLQRLFRNGEVAHKIKRCNDFGAGGVSVAIGELADGLEINLDAVRKKYDGLDGTELAISESQERMAVVVAPQDEAAFLEAAAAENLEAYRVAVVTESPRLRMTWNGTTIADLSRAFLSSNGADKHTEIVVPAQKQPESRIPKGTLSQRLNAVLTDLSLSSQRGLGQQFDSTIGAGSVLSPFGGKTQRTPCQVMAALLPVGPGHVTEDCSVMAYGFDPYWSEQNPFVGAATAVTDSICKLVAAGCDPAVCYLSFQEYFERLNKDPRRWGKPFAALLGGLTAQLGLSAAAIGGKDSMSGSFLDLDVPPTLISFAISPSKAQKVLSGEFKETGHPVYLFETPLGDYAAIRQTWAKFHALCEAGRVKAAWAVGGGGIAEGLVKMALGNEIGFRGHGDVTEDLLFAPLFGSIVAECDGDVAEGRLLGHTIASPTLELFDQSYPLEDLKGVWDAVLEDVYPTRKDTGLGDAHLENISCNRRSGAAPAVKVARPRAVIPVFPGTNCEYDTANACLRAGIEPEILVVRNGSTGVLKDSAQALRAAIDRSQMIILPGGFSGGDEPDGSGKFIASFFRNPSITDGVHDLLGRRDGLMLGICNGFQALIKLGLVPYGEIRPMTEDCATLTRNLIGRHQSCYVTTRVASVQSPWMLKSQLDDLYTIPVSHGEGRFVAPPQLMASLIENGQVATQYVDAAGTPSLDISVNPNGSMESVEGIFSPDGRVFGKMGHSERSGTYLGKNIPGNKYQPLFESGAAYFK